MVASEYSKSLIPDPDHRIVLLWLKDPSIRLRMLTGMVWTLQTLALEVVAFTSL